MKFSFFIDKQACQAALESERQESTCSDDGHMMEKAVDLRPLPAEDGGDTTHRQLEPQNRPSKEKHPIPVGRIVVPIGEVEVAIEVSAPTAKKALDRIERFRVFRTVTELLMDKYVTGTTASSPSNPDSVALPVSSVVRADTGALLSSVQQVIPFILRHLRPSKASRDHLQLLSVRRISDAYIFEPKSKMPPWWNDKHDSCLLTGVLRYGLGPQQWTKILSDPDLLFHAMTPRKPRKGATELYASRNPTVPLELEPVVVSSAAATGNLPPQQLLTPPPPTKIIPGGQPQSSAPVTAVVVGDLPGKETKLSTDTCLPTESSLKKRVEILYRALKEARRLVDDQAAKIVSLHLDGDDDVGETSLQEPQASRNRLSVIGPSPKKKKRRKRLMHQSFLSGAPSIATTRVEPHQPTPTAPLASALDSPILSVASVSNLGSPVKRKILASELTSATASGKKQRTPDQPGGARMVEPTSYHVQRCLSHWYTRPPVADTPSPMGKRAAVEEPTEIGKIPARSPKHAKHGPPTAFACRPTDTSNEEMRAAVEIESPLLESCVAEVESEVQ